MEKIILLDTRRGDQLTYFDMDPMEFKILYHTNRIRSTFTVADICLDDTNFYVGYTMFQYKLSNIGKLYVKIIKKEGFSFKNKKVLFWFGGKVNEWLTTKFEILILVCKYLKLEWVTQLDIRIWRMLTKTMLEKILSKSITNPEDLMRYILKYKIRVKASHNLTLKFFKEVGVHYMTAFMFQKLLRYSSNPDLTIQNIRSLEAIPNIDDILTQCEILGVKYNPKWSPKRFNDFHTKCSKELMAYEIKHVPDHTIEYTNEKLDLSLIECYNPKLLTTSREIFEEGYSMHHCIYTNYMTKINEGNYFVISMTIQNTRVTVGIMVKSPDFDDFDIYNQSYRENGQRISRVVIEQVRGIRNQFVESPKELIKFVERNKWWFLRNHTKLQSTIKLNAIEPIPDRFADLLNPW